MQGPRFTISARAKAPEVPVLAFLARHFSNIPVARIDSVFGFAEYSPLYGGRAFQRPELNDTDIQQLYFARIGLRLPLTNHYVDEGEYLRSRRFLERHHREGNAIICTNDELARWVRRDFPQYRIEGSVIKNLKSHDRIVEALEIYDTVVLPMELNEEEDFLRATPKKEQVTLFANAGCALTCPSKICYPSFSKFNKTLSGDLLCSQTLKERDARGMVDFDLERLTELGFSRFKLLRERPGGMTGH
ncbi:MAG: hypothetical protein QM759_01560 [Terricaulis sp.]